MTTPHRLLQVFNLQLLLLGKLLERVQAFGLLQEIFARHAAGFAALEKGRCAKLREALLHTVQILARVS
jgi:hypothetical protein